MKPPDIDALARLLDGDLPEGEAPAEARALGAFARALEGSAAPPPTFAGKLDLRAALIEAAREQQAPAPTLLARMRGTFADATTRWRYSMRLAAATGASAMALSSGGVALAAQQALPGDALYGVKLALDDVGLLFVGDQAERGVTQLANAGERMAEAQLSAEGQNMAGAARALREADTAARAGARDIIEASQERGDPTLLEHLITFSAEQRDRLTALLPLLSGEAELAANDAMVALNRMDQRVAVLGGSCAECGSETVTSDAGRQTSTAPSRATQVADARDFDFAHIPHASEPFSPCPCVSPPASTGTAVRTTKKADKTVDRAKNEAAEEKPRTPRKAAPPPEDPDPAPEPEDEGPVPDLPDPVDEPVDQIEKEAGKVVDEVLDKLPIDPPPLPSPPADAGDLLP